jgi:hypothetical protein
MLFCVVSILVFAGKTDTLENTIIPLTLSFFKPTHSHNHSINTNISIIKKIQLLNLTTLHPHTTGS